jgi:methionyl-tRNA formyltransferase
MSLIVLSTDTPHHRFFLQKIHKLHKIDHIFFETTSYQPNFDISSPFSENEKNFELEYFFKNTLNEIPSSNIHKFSNMNSDAALKKLHEIKPEIGIVFGTRKLNEDIISSFSLYLMNVHRGIPQYYRGLDSDLWAIQEDKYNLIGTTIHLVESELDTGDILGQKYLEINKNMKIHEIRYHTTHLAVELTLEILSSIKNNSLKLKPQVLRGKYFTFMPSRQKEIITRKFNTFCKGLSK